MQNAAVELNRAGETLTLLLKSNVVDDVVFPQVNFEGVKRVVLDLSRSDYMNSIGIKAWMIWVAGFRTHTAHVTFELVNVRPFFVRTQSSIRDFLPVGSKMTSVFVPYYCDSCSQNHDLLYKKSDFPTVPTVELVRKQIEFADCPGCKKKMEIDDLVDFFAQFIVDHI